MINDQRYDSEIVQEIFLAIKRKSVENFHFNKLKDEYGEDYIDSCCKCLKEQGYIVNIYTLQSNAISSKRGAQSTKKIRHELTCAGKELLNE